MIKGESKELYRIYFLENPEDKWHEQIPGVYHLTGSFHPRQTAYQIEYPIEHDIETKSIMEYGRKTHKEIQDAYLKVHPFGVAEFPTYSYHKEGKVNSFTVVSKIDLLDFENRRTIDIKTTSKASIKWLKGRNGVLSEDYAMQTVYNMYCWNQMHPDDVYTMKEAAIWYVERGNLANDFYIPVDLTKYEPQKVFEQVMTNAFAVHRAVRAGDWSYLSHIKYGSQWLCEEYTGRGGKLYRKDFCKHSEKCKAETGGDEKNG